MASTPSSKARAKNRKDSRKWIIQLKVKSFLRSLFFAHNVSGDYIAVVFLLGCFNWVGWVWWSKTDWAIFNSPTGKLDIYVIAGTTLIGLLPLILAIIGTAAVSFFGEKWAPISPLSISFVSSGIFAVTFWDYTTTYALTNSNYFPLLLTALFLTNSAAFFETQLASRLFGYSLVAENFNKKFYQAYADTEAVAVSLRSRDLEKLLHIRWRDQFNEGDFVTKLSGGTEQEGELEFHIIITPLKGPTSGTAIGIIAYDKSEVEIKPIENFDVWVEGKRGVMAKYLKDNHNIELLDPNAPFVLSEALRDKILAYNRGFLYRAQERVGAVLGRIIIVILSIPVLTYLHDVTNIGIEGIAVIFVSILAWQFGPLVWSRRQKVRG